MNIYICKLKLGDVELILNSKITSVNVVLFPHSLTDNLTRKLNSSLFDNDNVLHDMKVFNKNTWPENLGNIRHGEEIHHLSRRFSLLKTHHFWNERSHRQ